MTDYELIEKTIGTLLNNGVNLFSDQSDSMEEKFQAWCGIDFTRFMDLIGTDSLRRDLMGAQFNSANRGINIYMDVIDKTASEQQQTDLKYGFSQTPFGECIMASTEHGVCNYSFTEGNREAALKRITDQWNPQHLTQDDEDVQNISDRFFSYKNQLPPMHFRGSQLQISVWKALLSIPFGGVATYGHVAQQIHNPRAVRAVATCVGLNPIAVMVPCHRVIRSEGMLGNYYWGTTKKACILGWEMARIFSRNK